MCSSVGVIDVCGGLWVCGTEGVGGVEQRFLCARGRGQRRGRAETVCVRERDRGRKGGRVEQVEDLASS